MNNNFDFRGVSLYLLKQVGEYALSIDNKNSWSIGRINNVIIGTNNILNKGNKWDVKSPSTCITFIGKYSLIDMLKIKYLTLPHPILKVSYEDVVCNDKAEIYVSYSYESDFFDLINSIELYLKENDHLDKDDTYFHIDMFVNNQWDEKSNKSIEWFESTLPSSINEFGHVIILYSPLHDVNILNRSWCLYEIYCSITNNCKMDIIMNNKDKNELINKLESDANIFSKIINNIDLNESKSYEITAMNNIKIVLNKQEDGINKFNSIILYKLIEKISNFNLNSAYSLINMANQYRKQKLFNNSLMLYKTSIDILVPKLGDQHVTIGNIYNNIAKVFNDIKEFDKSLLNYQMSLDIFITTLGNEHSFISNTYSNMGSVYFNSGDLDQAVYYYALSLAIDNKSLGEDSVNVAYTMINIGRIYNEQDKNDEALNYFIKSLNIFNKKLENNHLTICGTYDCITSIYLKIKNYDEVIKYSKLALDIKIAKLGDINISVGTTCSTLAIAYGKLNKFDDSLKYYHISLDINIKLFGSDDLSVANIYNNMAIIYKNKKEYDDSIEMYQKSLEIRISKNGILQNIYDSIASVYLLKGDYYEALKNYKISYDINRLILGNGHEIVLTALNNMEMVKKSIQSLQVNKMLPKNVLIPIHQHNLNIINNYDNPGFIWKCIICNKNGVGIKYNCGIENCNFECHPYCCCDESLFTFDIDFDLIVIE